MKRNLALILIIYLLGLLIGGLYVGMVAPVRTVIQASFGVDDTVGIWVINIYTLFYAAFIPIMGKLADRVGRKRVFAACLGLFAVGALLCGLCTLAGATMAGFALLLLGRVLQAIGAGGIIPVANAEIGVTFPADKRGMALGIAAATIGLANVLGSAVGSALLGLLGTDNWAWLFLGCVPLCLLLAAAAWFLLPSNTMERGGKLDVLGAVLFVSFVLFLLLAFKGLDPQRLGASLLTPAFWALLIAAIALALAFRSVEHRAPDPVFHMEYLHRKPIVITMLVSFFIGAVTISMTLIPQYAEFLMDAQLGSGGYYMAVIGVFSLLGPVLGGKLIDRVGPKPVLMAGLVVACLGYAFLALVVTARPSPVLLLLGLAIVGLGMGFAMGAPTNYMVLENVDESESTAAVSTIALVRQMCTTLAPALFVGFIANNATTGGYQAMMLAVATCAALAAVALIPYRR